MPILNDQGIAMNTAITSDVIVAYSQCPRKAFFLLRGEPMGSEHEYERVLADPLLQIGRSTSPRFLTVACKAQNRYVPYLPTIS